MRSSLATLGWFVVLFLALPSASARERDGPEPRSALRYERHAPPASDLFLTPPRPLRVTAAASTTFLGAWDFESTLGCDAQGWTSHDITEQATYFHVADASELDGGTYGRLLPLRGAQSLWCGLPADSLAFPQCGWVEAPGYGNGWKQVWATKECIDVDLGAQITFVFSCDSEPNYDATYVEVSECGADTWVLVDGGKLVFDGVITDETHTTQITGFDSTSIEIRFRFNSDGAWSDEDGFWVGDGAILIDSLFVTDATGIRIPVEDFEDEAPGSQETEHWHVSTQAPFGDYAGLFWGGDVLQEDACGSNLSCFWGFFEGSTYDYSCGGHPGQPVVPYLNCYGWNEAVGLTNEVWSPWIAWAGTGDVAWLAFDVYRDLALDDFVFYTWRVRSIVDGCITRWQSDGWGYGDSKDW
ncbi:MAG: hypothetical protein OEO21_13300, partial [Candidatus Krumholzibacteria bacterium]|nr:hypothetical protein [Candidatus Krumholzibacteria bacterium]